MHVLDGTDGAEMQGEQSCIWLKSNSSGDYLMSIWNMTLGAFATRTELSKNSRSGRIKR